jgi:acetoin utilization protein AcuB
MTSSVVTMSPDSTLAEAIAVVRTRRIRHLPVVQHGRLVGIVTDRDLRLASPPPWAAGDAGLVQALQERTVADVMTTSVITVEADTPLEEAARQMWSHRIGCLPVTRGSELVGMLTQTDLMTAFTDLFSAPPGTRRLEVEVPDRPGELGHVVRLIGVDHRINIHGVVVPPKDNGDGCLAIMHLQVPDASRLVHALRRAGYRAGSPSIAADPDLDAVAAGDAGRPRGRALAGL